MSDHMRPGQLDLFDLLPDEAEAPDPVTWLARHLLNAHELLMIHRDDLDGARRAVTASMRGHLGDGEYHVRGPKVSYRYGGQEGTVTVARLVSYAAQRHDPAIGQQLADAYRRYVDAATRGRATEDPDYGPAADHLSDCARAWWTGVLL